MGPKSFLVFLIGVSSSAGAASIPLDPALQTKMVGNSLACIARSEPHDPNLGDPAEFRKRHPSFYGCYDWHASVINHWALLRTLNSDPEISERAQIVAALGSSFSVARMKVESEHIQEVGALLQFETSWFLALATELRRARFAEAKTWLDAIAPAERAARDVYFGAMKRVGVAEHLGYHGNTAFSMINAAKYADAVADDELIGLLRAKSLQFFSDTHNCRYMDDETDAVWISACLTQTELMSALLEPPNFERWYLNAFPVRPPQWSDIVAPAGAYPSYKVGLMLTKAASLKRIASRLKGQESKDLAAAAALQEERAHQTMFDYGYLYGDHWLSAYGLRAAYAAQSEPAARASEPLRD